MNSQSTAASSSSTTDVAGPSGRRGDTIENIIQEELDDGISKTKQKPKPPMEQALENDVVLLEIFRHSSPSDLKEFRLVNRKWNDTATSTLLIKNSLELVLGEIQDEDRDHVECASDPLTTSSHLSSQVKLKNGCLGSLTDLCCLTKASIKFPAKSLTFQSTYPEVHPQVRQLFKLFGNQVKELTFIGSCKVSPSFLRELLLELVPNIESLTLRGFTLVEKKQPLSTTDQDGHNSFEFDRLHSLPHLKELVFWPAENKFNLAEPNSNYSMYLEFFKELVDASVNLRSVYSRPLEFLDVLLDAGKVQLVKKLAFEPTRKVEKRLGGTVKVRSIAVYQKLASMKPEIKTLKMQCLDTEDRFRPRRAEKTMFESALQSILKSSKGSLRDFKIEMLPGFFIDLPVLPNLKKLKIKIEYEVQEDFSDGLSTRNPTFSFQRNFPHLYEVHLWLCSYMDFDIKDVFRGKVEKWVSPTVKHLTFRGNMSYQDDGEIDSPYEGPQTLGKIFPNATSAVIAYEQYMFEDQQLSSIIWHQIPAGVKRLSITEFVVEDPVQDIVDNFFTGIPIKICKRLRKWPQRICEEKDSVIFDALRTEPSICDFKNLKELNICCIDLRSDHPFASRVTGLYAFDLMPELTVTVTYKPDVEGSLRDKTPSQDLKRSMKQIAPYITQVCHQKSYP